MGNSAVVTGGAGFIGSYLVRQLVADGWNVGVVDNLARGDASRLSDIASDIDWNEVDVRDEQAVAQAIRGADVVFHLAAINGTENFYKHPELVLDVGIRGAIAVVNACRSVGVGELVVASSAEVYQTPAILPTPEEVALTLPNSLNPRYSYGGSKIATELIALNYGIGHFSKLQIFRPHNVYGPNMGWKHVIPQFIQRAAGLRDSGGGGAFDIQGDGLETRAFCYVDDAVDGIMAMHARGSHREIYHIGNDDEVSIRDLAAIVGEVLDVELEIKLGESAEGGTPRRCPDISKMRSLGYAPSVDLRDGIARTSDWYLKNLANSSDNPLL